MQPEQVAAMASDQDQLMGLNLSSTLSDIASNLLDKTATTDQASTDPMSSNSIYSWAKYMSYDFWDMYHNDKLNEYLLFNGGPWIVGTLICSYLYFVLSFGPKMMEKREPMSNLKPLIRAYNFSMVLFNAYLFYHASPILAYGLNCWGCGVATQPMIDEAIPVVWLVLISRFCDFFDTIFFVLRKKFSHVSFLHVFHHTVVPIGFWIGIKFAFFPVCCFVPYLNLIVHVIMYSYYGLSTFGPRVQKYLWWKKYLTSLQIAQFLIALAHSLQPLYLPTCSFPILFVCGQTVGAVVFLYLFMSFYYRAYVKQRRSSVNPTPNHKLQVPAKNTLVESSTSVSSKLKAQ